MSQRNEPISVDLPTNSEGKKSVLEKQEEDRRQEDISMALRTYEKEPA